VAISMRAVAGTHAAYLAFTGAWPLIHRASFERLTGRKRDFWLVRLVGGLALATGLSLGVAVIGGARDSEARVLALASGAAFTAADIYAVRAYSRMYAVDALLQVAVFGPAWLMPWEREGRPGNARQPATSI
jgi:hypothetical protein